MDFDQLRQLVAIADEGTMSAAADVLRMPATDVEPFNPSVGGGFWF